MVKGVHVRAVSAFLRNPKGRVIAQLRDDKPGLMFPNCWSTLGGGIEEGETPEQAVQREVTEEIEFCPPLKFWRLFEHHYRVEGRDYKVDIYAFVGETDCEIADIHLHEGQRIAYLSAPDIDRLTFGFGLDVLYREFFAAYDHRTGSDL
jgi:8-oxo-dGTP diphosphatase